MLQRKFSKISKEIRILSELLITWAKLCIRNIHPVSSLSKHELVVGAFSFLSNRVEHTVSYKIDIYSWSSSSVPLTPHCSCNLAHRVVGAVGADAYSNARPSAGTCAGAGAGAGTGAGGGRGGVQVLRPLPASGRMKAFGGCDLFPRLHRGPLISMWTWTGHALLLPLSLPFSLRLWLGLGLCLCLGLGLGLRLRLRLSLRFRLRLRLHLCLCLCLHFCLRLHLRLLLPLPLRLQLRLLVPLGCRQLFMV